MLRERQVFQQGLRMTQCLPQRMTDVRGDRVEQQDDGLEGFVAHRAAPVSYTHLDVYKRQSFTTAAVFFGNTVIRMWARIRVRSTSSSTRTV